MKFRSMPTLPPGSMRNFLQRRTLLTATIKCGDSTEVFVLKGACMKAPPETAIQAIQGAGSCLPDIDLLQDSDLLLSNVPEDGGPIESVVFSKGKSLSSLQDNMGLSFNPVDKSASLVRNGRYRQWATSNCFDLFAINNSSSLCHTMHETDFIQQGPVPHCISSQFEVPPFFNLKSNMFPYITHEILGEGGEATVFRGVSPVDGHEVAVRFMEIMVEKKTKPARGIFQFFGRPAKFEYVFKADYPGGEPWESQILRRLNHPNIKRMSCSWAQGDYFFIAQEMCDSNLHDLLDQGISNAAKYKISIGIFSVLKYLWVRKIFHRDIKPHNIFVDGSMNVKLGDFGSAIVLEHDKFVSADREASTLLYASPEIVYYEDNNHLSDVYGGGCAYFNIHVSGDGLFRAQMQMLLQELAQSPEWQSSPEDAWAASPLSTVFTGNPQVLFASMAYNASNRRSYDEILQMIHDWEDKYD